MAGVSLTLAGAPGVATTVLSPRLEGDAVLLTASGALDLGGNWTLSAETRALIGAQGNEVAGSVSVGWNF